MSEENILTVDANVFHQAEISSLMEDLERYSSEGNIEMYNQTLEQLKKDVDQLDYLKD